jgi:hypothetical protein
MTATSLRPDPGLFTILSRESDGISKKRETFVLSLLGHAAILALVIYSDRLRHSRPPRNGSPPPEPR